MLFTENGQVWESFVYVPKKPIALDANNKWDRAMVNDLVVRAKAGDNEAQMLLFEQYQYKWKKIITDFVDEMLTYEDAQQEAFYVLMRSLMLCQDSDAEAFTNYYMVALKTYMFKLTGKEKDRQKLIAFSLNEVDENGDLVHDMPDKSITEYMPDFSNIKCLLSDLEYKVVIAHYYMGYSHLEISKVLVYAEKYIRNVCSNATEKLRVLV